MKRSHSPKMERRETDLGFVSYKLGYGIYGGNAKGQIEIQFDQTVIFTVL